MSSDIILLRHKVIQLILKEFETHMKHEHFEYEDRNITYDRNYFKINLLQNYICLLDINTAQIFNEFLTYIHPTNLNHTNIFNNFNGYLYERCKKFKKCINKYIQYIYTLSDEHILYSLLNYHDESYIPIQTIDVANVEIVNAEKFK